MLFDSLSPRERQGFVLANLYQECRKKSGQFGYKVFRTDDVEEIRKTAVFKQFVTVCEFLFANGWSVGISHKHWQGYVKHVFASFEPNVPQPGQLKNKRLLRSYCAGVVLDAPEPRPMDDMIAIYRSVLHESLTDNATMSLLGLDLDADANLPEK